MANETNYEAEAEKVASGGDWVKLGVGIHKITFLEEIPQPVKAKKIINGKEQEIEQCDVLVDYKGERKKLSLTKGATTKSLWGQLMVLGRHHKSLMGKQVDIAVKMAKDKNGEERKDYTVWQVAELLQKQQTL